jgi:hypothetical protein
LVSIQTWSSLVSAFEKLWWWYDRRIAQALTTWQHALYCMNLDTRISDAKKAMGAGERRKMSALSSPLPT